MTFCFFRNGLDCPWGIGSNESRVRFFLLTSSRPKVSVVMGGYNGSSLISETVNSVLGQSFRNFEFIVVDDGSTDQSVEQLRALAAQDDRLRIVEKENEGLTRALRDGCEVAQGDYIARIDLGDTMTKTRLEKQAAAMDRFEACDLIASDVEFCGPSWEPLWTTKSVPRNSTPSRVTSDDVNEGLQADVAHHGSVMFRREAYMNVGGYRAEFYYGQDWDLWYRLSENGSFYVVPEILYKARYFPNAISMKQSERQKAIASLSLGAHIQRKKGESEQEYLRKASAIRPVSGKSGRSSEDGNYFIGEALRRKGNSKCRDYFRASIKNRPLQIKSYIRLLQTASP